MKKMGSILVMLIISLFSFAETPMLVFNGYINYHIRHDFQFNIYCYANGYIHSTDTFEGESGKRFQHTEITRIEKEKVTGVYTSENYKLDFEFSVYDDAIYLNKISEDLKTKRRNYELVTIYISPQKDVLFEDDKRRFIKVSENEYCMVSKEYENSILRISGNKMEDDGWYRVDWAKDGQTSVFKDYIAMDTPYEMMQEGGGTFIDHGLSTSDLVINVINFYVIGLCISDKTFLPIVFGIPTGSY
jgi:hypothetical protein